MGQDMTALFKGRAKTEHKLCQENLSAFLDGELKPRERSRVERHLEECSACRADLESLRETVALLHAVPTLRSPRSFLIPASEPIRQKRVQRRRLAYGYLQAATAAATVLLVLVVSGDVLTRYQFATPAMRGAEAPPAIMGTAAPAKLAAEDHEETWGQSPAEAPSPTTFDQVALVDAPLPTPVPVDRESIERQAIEEKAVPPKALATSADAPPVPPPLPEAEYAGQAPTASPEVSPTAMPTATPTAAPSPTPTPLPPQPTAQVLPLQPQGEAARERLAASPPSGLPAILHQSRSFLPWIEGLLVTAIAVLVLVMLWLRREQRST